MTKYVALLRAINVRGTGKLPMSDLIAMCRNAGFARVETYIASGNVIFESKAAAPRVKGELLALQDGGDLLPAKSPVAPRPTPSPSGCTAFMPHLADISNPPSTPSHRRDTNLRTSPRAGRESTDANNSGILTASSEWLRAHSLAG
jgi:hypothetical protein